MGCRKPQVIGSMEMHDLGQRAAHAPQPQQRSPSETTLGDFSESFMMDYLRNGRRETTAIRSSFVRTASQRAMAKSAL